MQWLRKSNKHLSRGRRRLPMFLFWLITCYPSDIDSLFNNKCNIIAAGLYLKVLLAYFLDVNPFLISMPFHKRDNHDPICIFWISVGGEINEHKMLTTYRYITIFPCFVWRCGEAPGSVLISSVPAIVVLVAQEGPVVLVWRLTIPVLTC